MTAGGDWISALVTGLGAGGFVGAFTVMAKTYIDRVRLGNEEKVTDEDVTERQWKRFQLELDRRDERIDKLEGKLKDLEGEIEECHRERRELRDELAERDAKILRYEAMQLGLGDAKQEAARIVAEDRIEQRVSRGRNGA